jgi:hypothetical protein
MLVLEYHCLTNLFAVRARCEYNVTAVVLG